MNRKYLPSIAELVDRMSIDTLKEVFIPEQKEHYREEISDIKEDLTEVMLNELDRNTSHEECPEDYYPKLGEIGELIHSIIVIAQMNAHIWYNETSARKGEKQDLEKLKLTHGLNGIRNNAKNKLLDVLGIVKGKDYKTDCLAAEFKDWDVEL